MPNSYLQDESKLQGHAEKFFLPSAEQEIVAILQDASASKIPVTIQGALTGLVGAAVPQGGWVINLNKYNKIISLRDNLIHIQPGVRLFELADYLEQHKKIFPVNVTEQTACLGGSVSTNAGGSRSFKYGRMRNYVEYLKIILVDGQILEIPRGKYLFSASGDLKIHQPELNFKIPAGLKRKRNYDHSAGYYLAPEMDLIDLLIGSEGTLGVISEIKLKVLEQKNQDIFIGLIFFDQIQDLYAFSKQAIATCKSNFKSQKPGLSLRALEYIDSSALNYVRSEYSACPENPQVSALLIEQETEPEYSGENFMDHPAIKDLFALLTEEQINSSWFSYPSDIKHYRKVIQFRHRIPEKVNQSLKYKKMGTDLIADNKNLDKILDILRMLPAQYGLKFALWGHLGKCSFHLNLLPENQQELEKATKLYKELCKKVVEIDGSIAGEHGLGKNKAHFLPLMYSEEEIAVMKNIKSVFDPNNLLGKGNLFD